MSRPAEPTAPDPSSVAEAQAILTRYRIEAPDRGWAETPDEVPGEWRLVAGASTALEAAGAEARRLGYKVRLLECEGEARDVALGHAGLAFRSEPGTALISGGELTVTVRGSGRGGPNQEYALPPLLP